MVRICIIQGHPTRGGHFCHAMADAYSQGADAAGHGVRTLCAAKMEVSVLRSKENWDNSPAPAGHRDRPTDHQLGRASRYHPSALDGRNAGAAQGFLRAGAAAGVCDGADPKRGLDQAVVGRSARGWW